MRVSAVVPSAHITPPKACSAVKVSGGSELSQGLETWGRRAKEMWVPLLLPDPGPFMKWDTRRQLGGAEGTGQR